MDRRVEKSETLTQEHIEFLKRIEAGLALTADLCRADILLCTPLAPDKALVARHMMPKSTTSLYRKDVTGRTLTDADQPLLFRTLKSGSSGRGQKEVLSSGAPVIQDCFPIVDDERNVLAALIFETNMVAYERHRRRNRAFRQATRWLQEMCLNGELVDTADLSRFGMYDGVYLVDAARRVVYMNGIVANMFRAIGIVSDISEQSVDTLEPIDSQLVEEAFLSGRPAERRHESQDGRIWIRKVIPLHAAPVTWQNYWQNWSWYGSLLRLDGLGQSSVRQNHNGEDAKAVDAVMVIIHNATEAVQKQRELNVKSAIIQEVHHRVKNNLQTIAAILRIQARRCETEEARQHLSEAVNRILSMSVIHEFLSQDEHRPINVRDVCLRVANQVAQVVTNPEQSIKIEVEGPNIRLPAGQATPTALVINELLLNAMEHGVNERMTGTICIYLEDLGDAVRIIVEDDGPGLPPDFDLSHSRSLGLQIVHTLVTDDLKGDFRMESRGAAGTADGPADEAPDGPVDEAADAKQSGTLAIITFPKRSLKAA